MGCPGPSHFANANCDNKIIGKPFYQALAISEFLSLAATGTAITTICCAARLQEAKTLSLEKIPPINDDNQQLTRVEILARATPKHSGILLSQSLTAKLKKNGEGVLPLGLAIRKKWKPK